MNISSRFAQAFVLVVALAVLTPVGAEAKKIYIGISNPDMSFLSGGVAQFEGYFKDEVLDVELIQSSRGLGVQDVVERRRPIPFPGQWSRNSRTEVEEREGGSKKSPARAPESQPVHS